MFSSPLSILSSSSKSSPRDTRTAEDEVEALLDSLGTGTVYPEAPRLWSHSQFPGRFWRYRPFHILHLLSFGPHRAGSWKRTFSTSILLLLLTPFLIVGSAIVYGGIPASYSDIRRYERSLPQHNWTEASRVGSRITGSRELEDIAEAGPKFLRFPDHLWGHGLNNILQEALLTSYIAFASDRSFVFEDYVWSSLPIPYTLYDFALRPTRIPLNAFITGPLAGGPFRLNLSDSQRYSVSAEYYEHICPPDARISLTHPASGIEPDADGLSIVDWWRCRLDADDVRNARCVEIREDETRVFDANFFGSPRILPLFSHLRESPILAGFSWSPLVLDALQSNLPRISQPPPTISNTHIDSALQNSSGNRVVPGLVAVHLRRGDYKRHCLRLANWGSGYMGFNQFNGLLDTFEPLKSVPPWNVTQAEQEEHYLRHCLPTIPQLVERLHDIRRDHAVSPLSSVYILTNAWPSYISTLSDALAADGWSHVASTMDLESNFTPEQKHVSVGVDMALAVANAEVFVGNGFSSLSANIVMLRTAQGLPLSSNRFL